MRVLCLDQATHITGYSVCDNNEILEYGIITTDNKEKNTIRRIREVYDRTKALIHDKQVSYVVLEGVQFQQNQKAYSTLSQLQGALFALCFNCDLGFCIVEPSAWKATFGVKGRARAEQKADTIRIVSEKYGIEVSEDEADAIGIAYWALHNLIHV